MFVVQERRRDGGAPDHTNLARSSVYGLASTSTAPPTTSRSTDRESLLEHLPVSHETLCGCIAVTVSGTPLDADVCVYGETRERGDLPFLASKDYYHAGQIAVIRMATGPGWDY